MREHCRAPVGHPQALSCSPAVAMCRGSTTGGDAATQVQEPCQPEETPNKPPKKRRKCPTNGTKRPRKCHQKRTHRCHPKRTGDVHFLRQGLSRWGTTSYDDGAQSVRCLFGDMSPKEDTPPTCTPAMTSSRGKQAPCHRGRYAHAYRRGRRMVQRWVAILLRARMWSSGRVRSRPRTEMSAKMAWTPRPPLAYV
jgi:hypothetical protein